MTIFLGVDTGGTYTDAVLLQDEKHVLAKAKSLTTRHDLSVGIGKAIDAVLAESGIVPTQVSMASLSTTLATNALVEGHGGRVALVSIGFSEADIKRQGLSESLKGDPQIAISGGHNHAGKQAQALDLEALEAGLEEWGDTVSAFAVASQFATRNPEHELKVKDLLQSRTGKPVSCSHELSAKLNGPKRAMTAVLNARLIGMIDHLISSAETLLSRKGINAPLMVVRGDGALVSAAMARQRPIETILSGPAASIVGAHWLTGERDAMVSDSGGTTTDIAVLRDGKPMIDPQGARVGAFRTMVEAVAMRTTGLGGDSELHAPEHGLDADLFLGPRRIMPIALSAMEWPDIIHPALDRQLSSDRVGEFDGRFLLPLRGYGRSSDGLGRKELAVLAEIGDTLCEMANVIRNRSDLLCLDRLVGRGLVMISGVTPSDAAHCLEMQTGWDDLAAEKALRLFSRKRSGSGARLAEGSGELARKILDQLVDQTAEALLISAFSEDGAHWEGQEPEELARHVLLLSGLAHHRGLVALDAALNLPVIGLGASAPTYYPMVGDRVGSRMILPEHADVANALGAIVGQVTVRRSGTVTSPTEGRYRVHLQSGPVDYASDKEALLALEADLTEKALADAEYAQAEDLNTRCERDVRYSEVEGREMFVQAELTVIVSGRPRIAHA